MPGHLVAGQHLAEVGADRRHVQRDAGLRLDDPHQRLAELRVGNAEHSAIVDAGDRQQRRLDLGRVDVDAAGDDHVALAVADEDIAIGIDVADIARGDEAAAVDLGALPGLIVIGEIGIARDARIDLADLAGRQLAAVIADEAQLGAGRDAPHGARLPERILRGREGHRAGFGAAVEFVDHRPPPVDHRALDVGRARRGGVNDVAQRRYVVGLAHLLGQLHQPHEHRRHHEDGIDPIVLYQLEERLGIEARHQHQRAAEPAGPQAERIGRGVIERPRQQCARVRLEAVDQRPHPFGRRCLLRRRRVAAHALRMPRGAGSIDHVLRLRQRRPFIGRLVAEPSIEVARALRRRQVIRIDSVGGENLRRRRYAQHRDAGRDVPLQRMQQVGMADQHPGAGVAEDVGDLVRPEMPVHRHGVGAERHHGIGRLDKGEVVAHQDADAIARLDAELLQAAGDPRRSRGDLGMRAPARTADDAVEERGCGGHGVLLDFAERSSSRFPSLEGTGRHERSECRGGVKARCRTVTPPRRTSFRDARRPSPSRGG